MTTPLSPLHSGAAARLTAPAISEPLQLPLWKAFGAICLLVFMEFLALGLPLPILPSHVHETLGFGPLLVGVAMASAAVAALGQPGMWWATSGLMAVGAAALTGLGFSLAFPSFGVEAIRRVPPKNRGAAVGAYSACFDLTMGVGVPLLGVVVGVAGFGAAFAVSSLMALVSLVIAALLASRTGGTTS